jgi:hypothetical protein
MHHFISARAGYAHVCTARAQERAVPTRTATNLAHKVRHASAHARELFADLETANAVACNDVWVVVWRCLDTPARLRNLASETIAHTRLVICCDVVCQHFCPERISEESLDSWCRLGHHHL